MTYTAAARRERLAEAVMELMQEEGMTRIDIKALVDETIEAATQAAAALLYGPQS